MLLIGRRRRTKFGLPINVPVSLLSPDAMIHGLRASSWGQRSISSPRFVDTAGRDIRTRQNILSMEELRRFRILISVFEVEIGNRDILLNALLRICMY